jgi:hypothetical protein
MTKSDRNPNNEAPKPNRWGEAIHHFYFEIHSSFVILDF